MMAIEMMAGSLLYWPDQGNRLLSPDYS
jgi:hypothetical protein